MSSTSSAGSADLVSGSKEPECEPSPSARSSHTQEPSSPNTGQMSPATTMFEPSPPLGSEQTAFEWMSSAEVSPARTSAMPASEPGSQAKKANYGLSTPELLASYDRVTSSWRTSQRC